MQEDVKMLTSDQVGKQTYFKLTAQLVLKGLKQAKFDG